MSSWRDLILYSRHTAAANPRVRAGPASGVRRTFISFVAAFGAMGHHLQGMIRATKAIQFCSNASSGVSFSRRCFCSQMCVTFLSWGDLKGVLLVVFFWSVWHGLMRDLRVLPHLQRQNGNVVAEYA